MKHRNFLFIFSAFFISQITQAQKFSFAPAPGWVKIIEIPGKSATTKYDVLTGYYTTLGDYQVNLETDEFFTHEVLNVVSYGGITKASQISITYDTSYQQLRIHHLYIWRKGVKTDRTKALSLEIMNNQDALESGIYTGRITAYDLLDDIRKDDLIDFAYTLAGRNPIFNNEKYLFNPLVSINPIDLLNLRVICLKERDYTYHCQDCDSLVTSTETGAYREIEIKYPNVPALKFEENMPAWKIYYKYFILSSFKSWEDVNKWAQSIFSLPEEPVLDDVFKEIFTGTETTDEKINKIINYVQDDIRYMGIEAGIGSIKPFPPEQVVKQRFGDCKDKSLLLVSLLKKIGIEKAYPVLVNTILKSEIAYQYPSNQVFNHCIVTFEYNSDTFWVDPVITMQGGDFKDLYFHDYGKALIIGIVADSLSNMPLCKTKSGTVITDSLTIRSFSEPADLIMTSDRTGFEADNRRSLVEYFTMENFSDQLIKDLKLIYPIVNKDGELSISDDAENNKFLVTYKYKLDGFWQNSDKNKNESAPSYRVFKYEPVLLYQYLNQFPEEERKFDFEVNYPQNMNYSIIFQFPEEMLLNDTFDKYENEAFIFDEKVEQLTGKSFRIDYSISTKTDCISPSEYKKVCEQKAIIIKSLPIVIFFKK